MAKLSPPILATTIPAFYSENGTVKITVPYTMNRAVSAKAIAGFKIQIKTAQSSSIVDVDNDVLEKWVIGEPLIFSLTGGAFKVGAFYKIQIAYIGEDEEIGYFSSVAMGKHTYKPELSISGLIEGTNTHSYSYEGLYESADLTERVYSYRFDLYNELGVLVDTSGTLLHNADSDINNSASIDRYTFSQDLPIGKKYKIKYTVITNNGLEESVNYFITQQSSINPNLNATIVTKLNYDNGYIEVGLKANSDDQLISGSFILARSSDDHDYSNWEEISRFQLCAQIPTLLLYKDFTVEQGKTYKYSVQQYNTHGIVSTRILSNEIYSDFEDAFLFDGKRQLKIRFNPKISSFKKDLMETKIDTIGGKYPFIFRNGRVYYSEFPLSGLISYQMDEENLFMSKEDFNVSEKTTNLISENIAAERIFKTKVLEWLTNGKPKVFRSPTEGNFIVRLMNSSLTPNDTVGRMLHTFNSTAYEVADFNYNNLIELGFISLEISIVDLLDWHTIELEGCAADTELLPSNVSAKTVRFDDMPPCIIAIQFIDHTIELFIITSGELYVATDKDIISCKSLSNLTQGLMTYSHQLIINTEFDKIVAVSVESKTEEFEGRQDILDAIKENLINISKIDLQPNSVLSIKTIDTTDAVIIESSTTPMAFSTLPAATELTKLSLLKGVAKVTYESISAESEG